MVKTNSRKYISLVGLTALIISSLTITAYPAHADVIQSNECFPAVLMLKGSGEGSWVPENGVDYRPSTSASQEPFIHTNGHEGPVLGKLIQSFVNRTDPAETVSKVRFIGIEYPALAVSPTIPEQSDMPLPAYTTLVSGIWMNHLIKYNESYRAGAQMTLDAIKKDEARGCNTQYMLLSYSQGVISARMAAKLLDNNTDKIISSYVVGDPFQKANGVSSSRQFTEANTSPDTDGVGRVAINNAIKMYLASPFVNPITTLSLGSYKDSILGADPTIYQDDTTKQIVSRSLCHQKDPTCDPSLITDIQQHIQYFNPSIEAGQKDLDFEIAEFDKQIQKLANSTTSNPRERVLAQTPSLTGGKTSYNVANTRADDKCSWDENSDGTNEVVDASCGVHSVIHTSAIAKMTVTITDSFGVQYTLGSEVQTLNPEIIDEISSLDPNVWYQFKSYSSSPEYPWEDGYKEPWDEGYDPSYCLEFNQSPYSLINENYTAINSIPFCSQVQYGTTANDAIQVFKAEPYQTAQGKKVRILSGYDSNFSWTKSSYDNSIKISSISDSSDQDITPKLNSIINDKAYYSFKSGDDCLTAIDDYSPTELKPCDFKNFKQLFQAIPVSSDSSIPFGEFSVEKDTSAPTDVTGLRVEVDSTKVNLRWNYSTDIRVGAVEYEVYKRNSTNNLDYVGMIDHYTIFPIDLSNTSLGDINTYEVFSVDAAGNRGNPATVSFATPPAVAKPLMLSAFVANDRYSVNLNFPTVNDPLVKGIRIYDGEQVIGTISTTPTSTNNFVDYNVRPYIGDRLYNYELILSDNVTSVRSDTLRVSLR